MRTMIGIYLLSLLALHVTGDNSEMLDAVKIYAALPSAIGSGAVPTATNGTVSALAASPASNTTVIFNVTTSTAPSGTPKVTPPSVGSGSSTITTVILNGSAPITPAGTKSTTMTPLFTSSNVNGSSASPRTTTTPASSGAGNSTATTTRFFTRGPWTPSTSVGNWTSTTNIFKHTCDELFCRIGSHCEIRWSGPRCVEDAPINSNSTGVDSHGCGRGEMYTTCMPDCEDTCRGTPTCNPFGNGIGNSSIVNGTVCEPGCICRPNRRRNVQGNCVPNKRCWITAGCRSREQWDSCKTCEKTCDNPSGKNCNKPCISGCACNDGLVRSRNGQCVPVNECSAMNLLEDYDSSEN